MSVWRVGKYLLYRKEKEKKIKHRRNLAEQAYVLLCLWMTLLEQCTLH